MMPTRLRKPVLILAGLLAAWLLFAALALPAILRSQAERFVAAKTGHRLSIAELAFNPLTLTLRIGGLRLAEPDDQELLGFKELELNLGAIGLLRRAVVLESVRLEAPRASVVVLPQGRLNWSAFIEALKSPDDRPDEPLPRFDIEALAVKGGHLAFADRSVAPTFETRVEPLDIELADLSSLPDDQGRYRLTATTAFGARVEWQGTASLAPIGAAGALSIRQVALDRLAPYLQRQLRIAAPEGVAGISLEYRAAYAKGALDLEIGKIAAAVEGLVLRGEKATAPALALDRVELADGRVDLGSRSLSIGRVAIGPGRVALQRRADGRLDIQDWLPAAAAQPAGQAAAAAAPWQLELGALALEGVAFRLTDQGFPAPLTLDMDKLALSLSAKATVGGGDPAATVGKMALAADGLRLVADKATLFTLGRLAVEDGELDLAGRRLAVGRIALERGKAVAVRDPAGRVALLESLRPKAGPPAAGGPPAARPPPESSKWHFRLGRLDAEGWEAGFRDETVSPAAELKLQDIGIHAERIGDDPRTPVPVKAALAVAGGGRLEAEGRLTPAEPAADLSLRIADLSIRPAQAYLAAATTLDLAGGRLSAQGRATYGAKGYAYKGSLALRDLLVLEAGSSEVFAAWKSLATGTLSVTPTAIDVAELTLDGLDTKLLIAKDKTVNVQRALRRPAAAEAAPAEAASVPAAGASLPPSGQAPAAEAAPAPAGPDLGIERLRIVNGRLDFSDLSLALPFVTHVHDLNGTILGISSRPGAPGQVELDGRVDDYGLARAVGQLDFFRPTEFMDLKVVFRNVEMTRMTPYAATFAGRKIASGKLSLDLEYKIKKRQLQGENQVVMDQLTLGERVEVPGARDLPLDLAIAVLQDSDGRIDLGLPVSGSLDDPQFSYGQIVWKAIVNVVTKIVTAPFRALGALFGGGEKFENIAFEAGQPQLTPPEREKLVRLAGALAKRPGLAITVHGVHADIDRIALQDRQLRRTLAARIGQPVEGDADPGPMSTRQAKVQAALEDLFADRFGGGELAALKEGFRKANPGQLEESATGKVMSRLSGLFREKRTLDEAEVAGMKGADFHALLYERLRQKEAIGEDRLTALARARGEAAAAALRAAGAPADRLALAAPEKVETEGRDVPVKLVLGTAKQRAGMPADSPAAAPSGG